MARRLVSLVLSAVLTAAIAIVSACDNDDALVCKVDTDCSPGQICREERCGEPTADGGVSPDGAPTCLAEGVTCTVNDDCCSRVCTTTGRCGSITPVPTNTGGGSSGQPRCSGLYEVCTSVDCCVGYTCQNGACR